MKDPSDLYLDDPEAFTSRMQAILEAAIPWRDAGSAAFAPARGARVVRLADVELEAVVPLWSGRFYRGKVSVVDGDPGLGKSTLLLDIAARVTTGRDMPDGTPGPGPAGVVILSAEDGLADTIRPRLEAAGADLERVVAITAITDGDAERFPALPADLGELERVIVEREAALVVIDPFMAYLQGTVNSFRDQDVRRAIAPLAAIAERTGACVVLVRHLNKTSGGPALYRGGGSIGIIGAARTALLVARDQTDPDRRVLAPLKSNLQSLPQAFAFRLVEHPSLSVAMVAWEGPTADTADSLLTNVANEPPANRLVTASVFLASILKNGPVAISKVEARAGAEGISGAALRRAKKALHVKSDRVGGLGRDGYWVWSLPAKGVTDPLTGSSPEDEPLRQPMSALAGDTAAAAGVIYPASWSDEGEDGTSNGIDITLPGWTFPSRGPVAVLSTDEERVIGEIQHLLETGALAGRPPMFLGPGVELRDVELAVRTDLRDAHHPGVIGKAARDRLLMAHRLLIAN